MEKKLPTSLRNFGAKAKTTGSRISKKTGSILGRWPFVTFLGLMAILVGLVVLGNKLREPAPIPPTEQTAPQTVTIYPLGGNAKPEIKVQAKIEKSGIIKLVAQTGGVVQKIKFEEGDHVKRGSAIFNLSTTYQGANAASVARQLSQKNYQFILDTYDAQKEVIDKNRQLSNNAEAMATELREITRQSLDDTRRQISLNEEIMGRLEDQIEELEASNVGGVNDAAITQLKASLSQTLAAVSGLKAGLRVTEYQSSDSQEPAEISRLARDAALKQLEIQEKALQLTKEVAQLSLRLAQINESLMYPASPCPGTIERVHVKVGQMVTPGTVLATIRGDENTATAVALIPGNVAFQISRLKPSTIYFNDTSFEVAPRSTSQEPTDGTLHSVLLSLPDELAPKLSDGSYIEIGLPIGPEISAPLTTYIPLDAVYYSQTGAYVYVTTSQTAPAIVHNRLVKLGKVYGQYVEVLEGLEKTDMVAISRTVIDGEQVTW